MATIRAVIFDLDGVIVSTDECHYRAWQRMADEEGIYFDRAINQRLRGVSRMQSLAILLERSPRAYTDAEREKLAERKNGYYRELIRELKPGDLLPGAKAFCDDLKKRGIKIAIASSSKNSPEILNRISLSDYFDATADGNDIKHSKPDPEVFLLAAKRLGVAPADCLVVEDANAGIEAALAGHMKALGVGDAANNPKATKTAKDLRAVTVDSILAL
jgi:beta-phosphoglucomutase